MKRRIIEIDKDKCNGCGACAAAVRLSGNKVRKDRA